MSILLIIVVGALNVACFFIGAMVGQTAVRGEDIKQALPNPIEAIKEHNDRKAAEWEQDKLNTIMQNIESYDGTSNGQKDVPRG